MTHADVPPADGARGQRAASHEAWRLCSAPTLPLQQAPGRPGAAHAPPVGPPGSGDWEPRSGRGAIAAPPRRPRRCVGVCSKGDALVRAPRRRARRGRWKDEGRSTRRRGAGAVVGTTLILIRGVYWRGGVRLGRQSGRACWEGGEVALPLLGRPKGPFKGLKGSGGGAARRREEWRHGVGGWGCRGCTLARAARQRREAHGCTGARGVGVLFRSTRITAGLAASGVSAINGRWCSDGRGFGGVKRTSIDASGSLTDNSRVEVSPGPNS
jgi:hypothetical protein